MSTGRSRATAELSDFDALYEKVASDVCRYATRRLRPADAEDVIGSVWVAVARRYKSDDAPALSPAWVMAVTRNKVVDVWRSRDRDRRLEDRVRSSSSLASPDPADVVIKAAAGHLLDELPGAAARVLELKYLERMRVKEIASELSVSETAVESRLARARRQLAAELGDHPFAVSADDHRVDLPAQSKASCGSCG